MRSTQTKKTIIFFFTLKKNIIILLILIIQKNNNMNKTNNNIFTINTLNINYAKKRIIRKLRIIFLIPIQSIIPKKYIKK